MGQLFCQAIDGKVTEAALGDAVGRCAASPLDLAADGIEDGGLQSFSLCSQVCEMQTARQIGPRVSAERMAGLVLPVQNDVKAINESGGFVRDCGGSLHGHRFALAKNQADGDRAPVLLILELLKHQPQSRDGTRQLRMFVIAIQDSLRYLSTVSQFVIPIQDTRSLQPDAVVCRDSAIRRNVVK